MIESILATRLSMAHGLTILPFWTAERSPTWPEQLNGVILGITQATTAADLLQALTESVYLRLASIKTRMLQAGLSLRRINLSGGIGHSRTSIQRLADVLGHPLHVMDDPEASLRGAAVFGLEKLGCRDFSGPALRAIEPRPRFARCYTAARQAQERLEAGIQQLVSHEPQSRTRRQP